MLAVNAKDIVKSYDDRIVVKSLSFKVNSGEIFGLIGPNGAGKTTTIRMIMDIIKPDSGAIEVLGEKPGDSLKSSLGYLPEERGLYRKQKVMDAIVYLAALKGMDRGSSSFTFALSFTASWVLASGSSACSSGTVFAFASPCSVKRRRSFITKPLPSMSSSAMVLLPNVIY